MENIANEQELEKQSEKQHLIEWIKEHKVQLLFAGASLTTLTATILGLKNRAAIMELWETLKSKLEQDALYSAKWFEKSNLDELNAAREIVQKDYMNPNLDMNYRNEQLSLMKLIDRHISKKSWAGQEFGYPVYSENGPYLLNKD